LSHEQQIQYLATKKQPRTSSSLIQETSKQITVTSKHAAFLSAAGKQPSKHLYLAGISSSVFALAEAVATTSATELLLAWATMTPVQGWRRLRRLHHLCPQSINENDMDTTGLTRS
jgi:hypothetical protein